MNEHAGTHLPSELLQAMAEGEADPERVGPAREHLAGCGRCRSELEAWGLLFQEIHGLPDLGPAVGFADRVMERVEVRVPLGERLRGSLRALLPRRQAAPAVRHLSPGGIQEYLEGQLGLRTRQRVEEHLAACGGCLDRVADWRPVFDSLGNLPGLAPSAGFAEAVMARVPVEAIARVSATPEAAWPSRLAEAARRLVPSTRRGWAVAAGVAAAPAAAMAMVVAAVTLHPLLSFGGLLTFARWRLAEAAAAGWVRTVELLGGSILVQRGWEVVSVLLQAPGAAAFGVAAAWASFAVAAWVLYQHVIAPSLASNDHANASS